MARGPWGTSHRGAAYPSAFCSSLQARLLHLCSPQHGLLILIVAENNPTFQNTFLSDSPAAKYLNSAPGTGRLQMVPGSSLNDQTLRIGGQPYGFSGTTAW